ncbi:MAG TPA: hypothetical protein VLF94_02590 [Chlamydiales bacterium]|nr:hypothetical protein [Chlamydiales bacterium]
MKYLLPLFFASALLATVNEPLRLEVFSGYRNDRVHWHLQEAGEGGALTYSELYRDIEYWENGLTFKVIHRDLSFFLRGAYGTFGQGTLFEKNPGQPNLRFGTNGWTADGTGYFGYAVNLTADRTYKVLLTPLIGYSVHAERLQPRDFRLLWNGFLFGAGFTVEPGGGMVFNVGYAYNLLTNNVHTKFVGDTSFRSLKTHSGGNPGQTGWAQMDWLLPRRFRIGVGGQINYFTTRVVDARIRQTEGSDLEQKFKLRWTPFSCWLAIAREL